jgi:hypothetical protein
VLPNTGGKGALVCVLLVEWKHECAHYWWSGGVSVPTTSGKEA